MHMHTDTAYHVVVHGQLVSTAISNLQHDDSPHKMVDLPLQSGERRRRSRERERVIDQIKR